MERDRLVAEWCRLVGREDKVAQLAPVSLGGRGNKSGEREAARQLGLDRDDVRRAIKVASICQAKLFHRKKSSTIAALKNMCAWSVL